jgi:flagellar protein FliO/FliZ
MKLVGIKKYLVIFLLLLLLGSQLPSESAYAVDDPNMSVKDSFKDKEKQDEEHEEIELDNESPAAGRSDGAAVGPSVTDYIRVVFALLFVIGLLYGLLKLINRKNRLYDKTRLMKNMGGLSLGQHKSIQLVVIGESYYLIGVGDDIRLLKEITDPEEIIALQAFYEGENSEATTATGMLNRILMKMPGKSSTRQAEDEPAAFSHLFQSKLNELKEERKRQISKLTEKERDRNE